MKALRIKLVQNKVSYSREETVNNKMTYPFPPYSTIIGALHTACGYEEYHPMYISVQGKYGALQKEIYMNHGLLNRTEDDRGILIWLQDPNKLSAGYIEVAKGLNTTGNSFYKENTIEVKNRYLLDLYKKLKDKNVELEIFNKENIKKTESEWRTEKKYLKTKQTKFAKNSDDWSRLDLIISEKEKKIKALKLDFEDKKRREYEEPYSHFKTLTKGPQYQEVLYDVELVIHVKTDDKTLDDIMQHKYDFTALGRSEDFIELVEMKCCTITDNVTKEHMLPCGYSMLVNVDRIKENQFYQHLTLKDEETNADGSDMYGTVYYVTKDYSTNDGLRVFNRIPCLYSSGFAINKYSENIAFDKDGGYIVDFN